MVFGSVFLAGAFFLGKLVSGSKDLSERQISKTQVDRPKKFLEIFILEPKSVCQHLGSLVLDLGSATGRQEGTDLASRRGSGGQRRFVSITRRDDYEGMKNAL